MTEGQKPKAVFVAFVNRAKVAEYGFFHDEYNRGKPLSVGRTERECRSRIFQMYRIVPRDSYRIARYIEEQP